MATTASGTTQLETLPRGAVLGLLLLYVLLYLLPLGARPLATPDEVRYGAIAHEMLASGDWVSPHLNGVRYFEKPVLGHWLNAASLAAFGENAFALRLPAALATGLTALILFGLARRFVSPVNAALATLIFLTTTLVAGVGTFAVLDPFLTLFLTAALAAYYLALEEPQRVRRYAYLVLCGVACAAAFLIKGFLGLAIPVIVAAPYLALRRQWRTLLTTPWLPIGVAALLILPWAITIHLREPDFWHYFFWVEHINRFAGADPQHARPVWFYVAYLPLTGWPWMLFLPAASIGLRQHGRPTKFLWYAAAWALIPLLLLSLAEGKLLTYILPCFPPASILLAAGLERYLAGGGGRAWRIPVAVIGIAFAAVLSAVLAAQMRLFGEPLYVAGELPKLTVLVGSLIAGAGCAATAYRAASRRARVLAIAGVGAALFLPLQTALPERAVERVAPGIDIARYADVSPDTILVSDSRLFGATAWFLKRNDVYVVTPGEVEYGLSYAESRHRWLKGQMLRQLIDANRGRREILIIGRSMSEPEILSQVPPTAVRTQHGAVIFWRLPAS